MPTPIDTDPAPAQRSRAYADINGVKMFYEIGGTPDPARVPMVLLHGAISATGTSSGPCRACPPKPVRS